MLVINEQQLENTVLIGVVIVKQLFLKQYKHLNVDLMFNTRTLRFAQDYKKV